MKRMRRIMIAAALVVVTSLGAVRAHAGLFKLDLGTQQNAAPSADTAARYAPEELLVKFIDGPENSASSMVHAGLGAERQTP